MKYSASFLPNRLTSFLVAITALVFPLVPVLAGYSRIFDGAYAGFLLLSAAFLGIAIFLPSELALTGSGSPLHLWKPFWQRSPVRLCLLAYLIWAALSAICSPHEGVLLGLGRREGLLTLALYLLAFWVVSSWGSWHDRFLDLLGAVLVINAGLGVLQYAGFNPLGLFPPGTNYHDAFRLYNGAFLGTLGNIDILSAFLCLTVPLFYGALAIGRPIRYVIPLAVGTFLLSLSRVDSGAIGLLGALVLTAPLMFSRPAFRSRACTGLGTVLIAFAVGRLLYADAETALTLRLSTPPLLLLVLGGLCLALAGRFARKSADAQASSPVTARRLWIALLLVMLGGIAALWALPFTGGALGEAHALLHGTVDPGFGSGRVRIWQETLKLIGEAPLLGGGPDTLIARMPFTFTKTLAETGETVEVAIDTAHNDFLNIAVNLGIPALLAYLGALVCWFVRAVRRLEGCPWLFILLPGILGYLLQSQFTFSICSVTFLFWILLALGETSYANAPDKQRKEK